MRIIGGTVRFTDRFADTLPRRQSRASDVRNAGSNPSNPGGSRSRRSSERLLTLLSSQAQEIPSASPSVRANPVMLKTPTAASLLLPASGYTGSPPERQCGRPGSGEPRVGEPRVGKPRVGKPGSAKQKRLG